MPYKKILGGSNFAAHNLAFWPSMMKNSGHGVRLFECLFFFSFASTSVLYMSSVVKLVTQENIWNIGIQMKFENVNFLLIDR